MKKTIIQGFAWNSAATYTSMIARFIGTMILARLLLPEDFGTIAYMASIFIVGTTILGWGVEPYIMKTGKNVAKALRVTLTLQIVSAAILTVIMLIIYPLLFSSSPAAYFWFFLIIGAGKMLVLIFSPMRSLILKEMHFKRFSLIVISSEIIGISLAIFGALSGWGLISLVIFTSLAEIISGVAYFIFSPLKVKLGFTLTELKEFFHFGKYMLAALFCDKAFRQADYITVKNTLGNVQLGYYSQAYKLSELFSNVTLGAIGSVVTSIFGKLKDSTDALARNYHIISSFVIRFMISIYLPFILMASQAIKVIYGEQWLPAVPIVQILAIYAVLSPFRRINRILHSNTGNPRAVFISQVYELITFLIILIPGVLLYGTTGAAIAVNIGAIAGIIRLVHDTKKAIPVQTIKIFLAPALASAVAIIIHSLSWEYFFISFPINLIIHAGIIIASFLATLFLLERQQLIWMIKQAKYLYTK